MVDGKEIAYLGLGAILGLAVQLAITDKPGSKLWSILAGMILGLMFWIVSQK